MTDSQREPGVHDEDLPEDLRPDEEENPLAEGLTEEQLRREEGPDRDELDVAGGGRRPEESTGTGESPDGESDA